MFALTLLLGNAGSTDTINELVFGSVPPFINRFMDGYETSPIIKSFTPEPSMSIAKSVDPECAFESSAIGLLMMGNSGLGTFPAIQGES